jgi:hypothetical protein
MDNLHLEERFLDKVRDYIDAGYYTYAVNWLKQNWIFCSGCATEMYWAKQELPSYDRTTGRPTHAWIWSCIFFWSAPSFHDAFQDFCPLSPTPPTTQDTIDTIPSTDPTTSIPMDLKSYLYLPLEDEPWDT